jgi:hypothetical protein
MAYEVIPIYKTTIPKEGTSTINLMSHFTSLSTSIIGYHTAANIEKDTVASIGPLPAKHREAQRLIHIEAAQYDIPDY